MPFGYRYFNACFKCTMNDYKDRCDAVLMNNNYIRVRA